VREKGDEKKYSPSVPTEGLFAIILISILPSIYKLLCDVYMLKVVYREGIHDHYKHFQQVPTIDIVVKSPAGVIARSEATWQSWFFNHLQRKRLLHFVRNDNFFDFLRLHHY